MIEFNGLRYYEDKSNGYWKTAKGRGERRYLHRAVYSHAFGNIPHGWHVHHKDEDRANNAIGNLECLPMREHVHRLHRPVMMFVCEQCGKEYEARDHRTNRWCSARCGWTWHNPRRAAKWQPSL